MTVLPLAAWFLVGFALLDEPLLYLDEASPQPLRCLWLAAAFATLAFELAFRARSGESASFSRARFGLWAFAAALSPDLVWRTAFGSLVLAELVTLHVPLRRSRDTFLACGRGLLACSILGLVLPPFLARWHELPLLHAPLALALRLLGVPAEAGSASIAVHGVVSNPEFVLTLEKLAFAPALALLAVTWVVLRSVPGAVPSRRDPWIPVSWAAFLALRCLVLVAHAASTGTFGAFYGPWSVLVSLLPWSLAVCVLASIRRVEEASDPPAEVAPRRHAGPLLAGALASASVAFTVSLSDPGVPKGGRILIDELHSDWEPTDAPLDRDRYGERTTYSYRSAFEFLSQHLPSVERNELPLSAERLAGADVLILKMPTRVYAPEEIEAIVGFVAGGGGVWLIGDHTDVFGSATCLNPVAERFGMRFNPDAVNDLGSEGLQLYRRPRLGVHPINAHMPPLLMATSCSLSVALSADCPMVSHTTWADGAGYGVFNFFGDHVLDGTESWGSFVQCAAARFGRGRVVAYADSTTLSTFSFCLPGNWEMTLATVAWLDRRDGSPEYRWLRLAALATFVATASWTVLARTAPWRGLRLEGLAAGVLFGLLASDALDASWNPLPRPLRPLPIVAFEREHGEYLLPLTHEAHDWDPNNYVTFFVWTQRLGLFPRVADDLTDALDHPVCVLLEPARDFDAEELERIDTYLRRGGRLLVMDDPVGPPSTAGSLLGRYGLRFGDRIDDARVSLDPLQRVETGTSVRVASAWEVHGGAPFLRTLEGRCVGAAATVGAGTIAVLGLARAFSVDRMGQPIAAPTRAQRALAELQFHVFDDVLRCGDLSISR
jgi:hypothetical protein